MPARGSEPCAACGRTTGRPEERDGGRSCPCRPDLDGTDRALEEAVRALLAARPRGATICPSEAARAVGGEDWRGLMEPARAAARRLVAAGEVEVTQGGRVVDPSTARGPVRVRRVDPG